MTVRGRYGPLVGAVDQGTTSTRFMVFAAETSQLVTFHQLPVTSHHPHPGWVSQDPLEILDSVLVCIEETCSKLHKLDIDPGDIVSVGITNQRETTIVWDKTTGKPLYPAIVWSDTRTQGTVEDIINRLPMYCRGRLYLQERTGLPLSTYFTAVKLRWLLDNIPSVADAAAVDHLLAGTVDSWLIWNLTGGHTAGGVHVTDVTNASRTLLMDLRSLSWDPALLHFFQIPATILPVIRSSAEIYGKLKLGISNGRITGHNSSSSSSSKLNGIPLAGCLGDQQAALVGQHCLSPGQAKVTYGTGCFVLANTGTAPVISQSGVIATVAYQLGPDAPAYYALEGSIAHAGSALDWLKSMGMGLTRETPPPTTATHPHTAAPSRLTPPADPPSTTTTTTTTAAAVPARQPCPDDAPGGGVPGRLPPPAAAPGGGVPARLVPPAASSEGVVVVPALGGLLAPRWRPDARATFTGLTQGTKPGHLVRATLEAIAYQVRELVECMEADARLKLPSLLVDGGLSQDNNLMQIRADVLGVGVYRPSMLETTALGAAVAAGTAVGVWPSIRSRSGSSSLLGDLIDRVWEGGGEGAGGGRRRTITSPAVDAFLPQINSETRDRLYLSWRSVLEKTLNLTPQPPPQPSRSPEDPPGLLLASYSSSTLPRDEDQSRLLSSLPGSIFLFTSFALWTVSHHRK